MKNRTNDYGTLYHPEKALVIYRKQQGSQHFYIESYDFNAEGNAINAHPLSVREANAFAKALQTETKKQSGFLLPRGLMPSKVLYINTDASPYVVWKTPAQQVSLLFTASLGLENGSYPIPPLIWKAGRNGMAVFAVKEAVEICSETPLYHAPFFNTYERGTVCMGNVALSIADNCALEDFMSRWEKAFFGSYFSHLMENHNPVNGNLVQLYRTLFEKKNAFPEKALRKSSYKIEHLIH